MQLTNIEKEIVRDFIERCKNLSPADFEVFRSRDYEDRDNHCFYIRLHLDKCYLVGFMYDKITRFFCDFVMKEEFKKLCELYKNSRENNPESFLLKACEGDFKNYLGAYTSKGITLSFLNAEVERLVALLKNGLSAIENPAEKLIWEMEKEK